jgi:hypothetical protein
MGQGRSVPEDASEFTRNAWKDIGVILVKYISDQKGEYGQQIVIPLKIEGLTAEKILTYVEDIKTHARGHTITITCNVGPGFQPTHLLNRILPHAELENSLKGTTVDSLAIFGDTVGMSRNELYQWWEEIKYAITYTGLAFHSKSEIAFHPNFSFETHTKGLTFV